MQFFKPKFNSWVKLSPNYAISMSKKSGKNVGFRLADLTTFYLFQVHWAVFY